MGRSTKRSRNFAPIVPRCPKCLPEASCCRKLSGCKRLEKLRGKRRPTWPCLDLGRGSEVASFHQDCAKFSHVYIFAVFCGHLSAQHQMVWEPAHLRSCSLCGASEHLTQAVSRSHLRCIFIESCVLAQTLPKSSNGMQQLSQNFSRRQPHHTRDKTFACKVNVEFPLSTQRHAKESVSIASQATSATGKMLNSCEGLLGGMLKSKVFSEVSSGVLDSYSYVVDSPCDSYHPKSMWTASCERARRMWHESRS